MNFLGSIFGAASAGVSAQELKTRLDNGGGPLLLDVRQPDEYRGGHIAGAMLIPLDQLERRLSELPHDRDIVCVCQSGARSGQATQRLTKAGFKAANLRGGMIGWQRAGYGIRKGAR